MLRNQQHCVRVQTQWQPSASSNHLKRTEFVGQFVSVTQLVDVVGWVHPWVGQSHSRVDGPHEHQGDDTSVKNEITPFKGAEGLPAGGSGAGIEKQHDFTLRYRSQSVRIYIRLFIIRMMTFFWLSGVGQPDSGRAKIL